MVRAVVVAVTLQAAVPALAAASGAVELHAVNLGSLGGGVYSNAVDINDSGQVTGTAWTAHWMSYAFRWTSAGGMQSLGTLGGYGSAGIAINAAGQVAGTSGRAHGPDHAFRWTPGRGMIDLGVPSGSADDRASTATAMNDLGFVTGTVASADGSRPHPFLWMPAGGMRDLGSLGGWESTAKAVNDYGFVVGSSMTRTYETHAYVWSPFGGMRDLHVFGSYFSEATGINDRGQVIGNYLTRNGGLHAFIWTPGLGARDLGSLGVDDVAAYAINDSGQVTGRAGVGSGEFGHAYRWSATQGMTDLATIPGDSGGLAINERGQVAGICVPAPGVIHPMRWTAGAGMQDLGTLGGPYGAASAINVHGRVVGQSDTPGQREEVATLWTAEPLPAARST